MDIIFRVVFRPEYLCFRVITVRMVHMEQGESQDNDMVGLQLEEDRIKEVWSHNLEDEFKNICRIVNDYPFVAMDTEFPGVVARPIGEFKSTADYQYQLLRFCCHILGFS